MTTPYLSIIIPAHNEAERIHACLQRWIDHLWYHTSLPFEIIVVPNGCSDATQGVLQYWREEYPQHIRVHEMQVAGKGLAVQAGMLAATGKFLYMADVDLSTPPEELHGFLTHCLSGADVVIGSRCKRELVRQSWRRELAGNVFHLLTRTLVPGIQDTQCGFKMFRQAAARDLFERMTITGYAFDVQILAEAQRLGYKIKEHPVPWTEAPGSKVRLVRDSLRMAGELITLMGEIQRERRERPVPA